MKQHFLIKSGHKQLLLFFAGWGMDENPFQQIHPTNCDWMICYDYRSLEFDETLTDNYSHITLIAWSMGVWAASQVMKQHPRLLISQRIAINGTLFPIDATKGIAPAVFDATLQGLNELTLQKFQRRMCQSSDEYTAFQAVAPQRPVGELAEELAAIRNEALSSPPVTYPWHTAIIGKEDRIFLSRNQRAAWDAFSHHIKEVNSAHYQHHLFNKIFTTIQYHE